MSMSSNLVGAQVNSNVDVSLEILRRMLDEESILLAQLSYVIEHIHNPIYELCNATERPGPSRDNSNVSNSDTYSNKKKSSQILTFEQYWRMFANISTLYVAQNEVVVKLEEVINNSANQKQQNNNTNCSDLKCARSSKDRRNSRQASGQSSIVEPFCSSAMQHYMAEHMMYVLNYSRSIAPNVMKLWRCWRICCGDKHANAVEQQKLEKYMPFLRFLWNVFEGKKGVPSDSRAVFTRLPETISLKSLQPPLEERRYSCTKSHVSSGTISGLPPIPLDWRGFETLLTLLAAPLSSLRRYLHVARCLIESRCLAPSLHRRLQIEFVDATWFQVEEEERIVLEELARHDVSQIVALFVEGPALPGAQHELSEKKSPYIFPDKYGTRVLVHYGRLVKRFCRGRHERLVFLFSDWFCYVEEQSNGRMRLCASIPLDVLQVVEFDDTADSVNGFHIVTKAVRLTFFAPTQEEKQQWVEALRNTAEMYKAKKQRQAVLQAQRREQTKGQQHHVNNPLRTLQISPLSLSVTSRLRRQQHADQRIQLCMKNHSTANPSTVHNSDSKNSSLFALPEVLADKQHEGGTQPQCANVTFDVANWAQQSTETVHRRIRSTDLVPHSWSSPLPSEPRPECAGDAVPYPQAEKEIISTTAIQMNVESPLKPLQMSTPPLLLSERFNGSMIAGSESQLLALLVEEEKKSELGGTKTITNNSDYGGVDGNLAHGLPTSASVVTLADASKT